MKSIEMLTWFLISTRLKVKAFLLSLMIVNKWQVQLFCDLKWRIHLILRLKNLIEAEATSIFENEIRKLLTEVIVVDIIALFNRLLGAFLIHMWGHFEDNLSASLVQESYVLIKVLELEWKPDLFHYLPEVSGRFVFHPLGQILLFVANSDLKVIACILLRRIIDCTKYLHLKEVLLEVCQHVLCRTYS